MSFTEPHSLYVLEISIALIKLIHQYRIELRRDVTTMILTNIHAHAQVTDCTFENICDN